MSFTLQKEDPSKFNILPIRWEEDPVESLSTINLNFENLDTEICNLSFSAENFWNPLYTEFQENSAKWESIFTTVSTYSSCWQSTYTTVLEFSGGWLSPITIMYPIPVGNIDINFLTNWVRTSFPVRRGGCLNYLNGQELYLYALEFAIARQNINSNAGKFTFDFDVSPQFWNKQRSPNRFTRSPNNPNIINVRCIGNLFPLVIRGKCSRGFVRVTDRYTKAARGFRYKVENFQWIYKGSL